MSINSTDRPIKKTGFKFCDKDGADRIMAGSIKLGALWTYRLFEYAHGDEWIGDRDDGALETSIRISGQATTAQADLLAQKGLIQGLEHDPRVKLDARYKETIDGFALCLADGNFSDLESVMCQHPSRPNYVACIEISDIDELERRIAESLGDRFGGLKPRIRKGKVDYDKSINDFSESGFPPPNPFSKARKYEEQSELRVFLDYPDLPRSHLLRGRDLFVNIGATDGLFKKRDVNSTVNQPLRAWPDREWGIGVLARAMRDQPWDGDRRDLASAYMALGGQIPDAQLEFMIQTEAPLSKIAQHLMQWCEVSATEIVAHQAADRAALHQNDI